MLLFIQRSAPHRHRFTLVELVVALVLLGILAAVSGMWIVNVAAGFERARVSAESAQKAQAAMARLTKEFAHGCKITSTTTTSISFTSAHYPGGQSVSLSGSDLLLGADILVDHVTSFTVSLATGVGVADTAVTFSLTLAGTESATYSATVYP